MMKSNRKKSILGVLLLLLALTVLSACGSSTGTGSGKTPTGSDTLRVGVQANIVGFGYYNENTGRYYGLEIDIAEDLAERLGYKVTEFVSVTPDTRKAMLLDDELDCVIACYSITESRTENLDFSPAYYNDYSVIMVEDSSLFTDITDLKGHTFGTRTGANTAPELAEKLMDIGLVGERLSSNEDNTDVWFEGMHLVEMDTYLELSDALEEGTIDALCADGCIMNTYMNDNRRILDFQISSQEYGVATQKDSALSEPVAETIQSMLDDGTIDRLIDKWD